MIYMKWTVTEYKVVQTSEKELALCGRLRIAVFVASLKFYQVSGTYTKIRTQAISSQSSQIPTSYSSEYSLGTMLQTFWTQARLMSHWGWVPQIKSPTPWPHSSCSLFWVPVELVKPCAFELHAERSQLIMPLTLQDLSHLTEAGVFDMAWLCRRLFLSLFARTNKHGWAAGKQDG